MHIVVQMEEEIYEMCPDVPIGNMSNLQMEGAYVDAQKCVHVVWIWIDRRP